MRLLLLIDGLRTADLLAALSSAVPLREAELVLVHVTGPHARAGLEMIRHRPGGHRVPPHRERGIAEAELERGAGALAEAMSLAGSLAREVRDVQLAGEPGHVVCELARREDVDLVALRAGGREQPPMGPRSLGPVARYVTDHCAVPVLLLRDRR